MSNVANAAAIVAAFGSPDWLLAVSLAAWLAESWFAVRVAVDRSLFRTLAAHPPEAADWLDSLLVSWKLIKTAKPRSIADRSQGALRLWRMQTAALTVQLAALVVALALRMVRR